MRPLLIFRASPQVKGPSPRHVLLGLLTLSLITLAGCKDNAGSGAPPETLKVKINGHTFDMELALDHDTRFQGLSERADIPADGGMLFAFSDASVQRFVMRKCLVPIDIVYVDESGRVTGMHAMQVEDAEGTMPENVLKTYSSDYPAIVALEFKGGTLEKLALNRGDPVDLPIADLKAWAE